MIETAIVIGSYAAMSASMSAVMAKLSPNIGPRLRNLFAGAAPLVVLFARELDGQPSVVVDGSDLLAAGGLLAMGVATSVVTGRIVTAKGANRKRLPTN